MRRWIGLLAGLLLAVDGAPLHAAEPVRVKLLAINDFHGALEPPSGTNGRIGGVEAGGAEYLAAHLVEALKTDPTAVVVAGGDMISASPLLSGLFHDEPAIESLNAMRLAVTSVGNHEFDEGLTELLRMQQGGCGGPDAANKCRGGEFKGAGFAYLAANVVRPAGAAAEPILPPYLVRTINGVKVGFIGETLKETPANVPPDGVAGLAFLDEADTANRYAAELKAQGVGAIVLLIHQGGYQNGGLNGCSGFNGGLAPILERLTRDIAVVVSAHSHTAYVCTIDGRLVTSAASHGRLITHIDLAVDPETGRIVQASAHNAVVTRDVEKDPAQTAIIAKYRAMAAPVSDRVVGTIARDITRSANRAGESALGDVIADAQLAATAAPEDGGAVVAFMNPGGIRADLVARQISAGEQPGEVTFGELFQVQPFGNSLTVLSLTGAQIKDLLEQQFDNPSPGRNQILQVSRGFSYAYRLNAPAGQRVDPASLKINGVAVDPARTYRTAQNNFNAAGGDNFTVFSRGAEQVGGEVDVDALVAWFKANPGLQPDRQERIVRLD